MSIEPKTSLPRTLIIMGVCGCGKTLIGERIAAAVGGIFEDADNFHTDAAREKMRAGTPLTDDDRWPWFDKLRARIEAMRDTTSCYVLACSALRHSYRERLRTGDTADALTFIYLDGSFQLIESRMAQRRGHYMPISLLHSQFAILETPTPDEALRVSIDDEPNGIVTAVLAGLGSGARPLCTVGV